ncbi:MAG: hypothetical protein R3A79_10175 [Nannocystaceae bacterium]
MLRPSIGALGCALLLAACGPRGVSEPTPAAANPSPSPTPETAAPAQGDAVEEAEAAETGDGLAKVERPPVVLPSPADAGSCPDKGAGDPALGILTAPAEPIAGEPLRVLAATLGDEAPLALRIEDGGAPVEATITHRPGVPAAVIASLTPTKAGALTVVVGRRGEGMACATVRVRTSRAKAPRPAGGDVWPIRRRWDAAEEALFSAWVRELFHAERGEELAYRALHEVTGQAERNLLHDALGWGEDADPSSPTGLKLRPDCADAPYFLRAYYAWKRALPFAFRKCSRGSPGKAPRCGPSIDNETAESGTGKQPGELGAVQHFFRKTLAWGVHTGNGRVAHGDDASDLYPVRLDRRGLRPGTVYADPYGHILVVVELVDPEGDQPGILYAIDGQPDGSITRKRFWEGNFLWNPDPELGGSGFKSFRPIVRRDVDGREVLVQLSDNEIAGAPGYGDFSTAQAELDGVAFYDAMEALITPGRRDPLVAQEEAITALAEAAKVRVTSVDNGERHFAGGGGTIAMPDGYQIFETTGAWESFSTPARDLRLLVAIDVVNGFADKVRRQPEVFGVAPGAGQEARVAAVIERIEAAKAEQLADPKHRFAYTRSDGKSQELGLVELLARADALEAAYNPNDCPELRWGAPAGSPEAATCKRRAPSEQRAKMERYRVWFHERRRPARGAMEP